MKNSSLNINVEPLLIPSLIEVLHGGIARQMMSSNIGMEKIRDENPLQGYIEKLQKELPKIATRFKPCMFTELHILLSKEDSTWSAYALKHETWRQRPTHHLTIGVESEGKTYKWTLFEDLDSELDIWYNDAEEKIAPLVKELRDYLEEVTPLTCSLKNTPIIIDITEEK